MANLKEIRTRINSVGSTMQITNAMKMVSASKLKRAQDAIVQMLPYAEKINELIQNINATLEEDIQSPYTNQRSINNILFVVITSNKGLCGGFNSNVIKEFYKQSKSLEGKNISLVTIGKKGGDVLSKTNKAIFSNTSIFDHLSFKETSSIAQRLMNIYANGECDCIKLIYNHFINAATQTIQVEQFLPILHPKNKSSKATDYIFEPSKNEIIDTLIPKALKIQFFKALRDSFASEHGARMTAMYKATDNAKELKDQLTLNYNKVRQTSITSEILEIVGGADALSDS